MQSGCRWVYTLMDWDTGEVVAKGTSVELVEQGYFPDVNKLSSVWNNLEKCKNPSPKNYRWKMERKSTKDDRVERALAYDVHDLMIYNEKAQKIGKPELTYGYWAEKGKPATP